MLINWSLMSGYLHDDDIETTRFGCFYQWLGFCFCSFTAIKWSILLFCSNNSQIANLLGEWGSYFGPKIIIDMVLVFIAVYIIAVKLLFIYASKHTKKLFYWLDAMEFNPVNQSFDKLNLNEIDSKMFMKRLSLSIFLLKCFTYMIMIFYIITNFVLTFKHKYGYYLNYLISALLYLPQNYLNAKFIFGFLVILYPVS